MILTLIAVLAGSALILVASREVFLTLFSPATRGLVTPAIMRGVWHLMWPLVRVRHRYRELIGPTIFVVIMAIWTGMIVAGFALVYWPFLPDEFLLDFGVDSDRTSPNSILTSLYFSLVVVTTLGFGDIAPATTWLRLLIPFEALIGFGLLTAGISYFLSIDPALSRRRVLVNRITIIRDLDSTVRAHWDVETLTGVFERLANELIAVRSDQVQLPITYYFRSSNEESELLNHLPYLLDLVRWQDERLRCLASEESVPARARISQHMLERAVSDYVEAVNTIFLRRRPKSVDDGVRALLEHRG